MAEAHEFGIGARRRPIGRDYAAAKDAEFGMKGLEIIGFRIETAKKGNGMHRQCFMKCIFQLNELFMSCAFSPIPLASNQLPETSNVRKKPGPPAKHLPARHSPEGEGGTPIFYLKPDTRHLKPIFT